MVATLPASVSNSPNLAKDLALAALPTVRGGPAIREPINKTSYSLIESNTGCDGKLPGRDGITCCTTSNKCEIGEGDCDSDADCTGNLVCGKDNCLSIFGHSPSDFDCCKESKSL